MEAKRLYRSEDNRVLAGVCAGLADYFQVDPVLVRLIFVALGFINGLGLLIYFIMWLVVPDQAHHDLDGEEMVRANASEIGARLREVGGQMRGAPQGKLLGGVILIVLGVIFMLRNIFPHIGGEIVWPLVLIIVGGFLLFRRL